MLFTAVTLARARAAQHIRLLALVAALTGCQSLPPSEPAVPSGTHQGLAFAQGACGGCHAVERYGLSPNPDAPPFAAIINRENLTSKTISSWLRDAHNYPEEMEFYLEQAEVDALVRYMLTLEDESYRPRNSS